MEIELLIGFLIVVGGFVLSIYLLAINQDTLHFIQVGLSAGSLFIWCISGRVKEDITKEEYKENLK